MANPSMSFSEIKFLYLAKHAKRRGRIKFLKCRKQNKYSNLTGPNPPPGEMKSGYLFKSSLIPCWWGVWDVDSLQGSRKTYFRKRGNKVERTGSVLA